MGSVIFPLNCTKKATDGGAATTMEPSPSDRKSFEPSQLPDTQILSYSPSDKSNVRVTGLRDIVVTHPE